MHPEAYIPPPPDATAPPFLPVPDASPGPRLCVCGEPISLEIERDHGRCVNCQAAATLVTPIYAMPKVLGLILLLGLTFMACKPPVPWPHRCRACGKVLDVGKPQDPTYRPICTRCYCRGEE